MGSIFARDRRTVQKFEQDVFGVSSLKVARYIDSENVKCLNRPVVTLNCVQL